MKANERKCGICQQNIIPKRAGTIVLISLVAANQPPIGGSAPGTAPIIVLNDVNFFIGVYISIYINMVQKDKKATRPEIISNKYKTPKIEREKPKK